MRFLVYERDPLVLMDILEILKDTFSGVIDLIEDLRDLGCCSEQNETPPVVILSVPGQAMLAKYRDAMSLPALAGVVIISDDAPVEAGCRVPIQFVTRPFNTGALVTAVNAALSVPLTDPSRKQQ